MFNLIQECNNFFRGCGFIYAFCGGYAFELYLNKKIRSHSDLDISIFEHDRKNIVEFILNKNWNIYGRTEHMKLSKITDPESKKLTNCSTLWVIKPNCSLIKLNPISGEEDSFIYEILNDEQLHFEFIDIMLNKQQDGKFICNQDKNITRELDISIMYNNSIPYLAPEIKLFFDSNPRYMELDYFKNKNRTDFEAITPFLPEENRKWLINALEATYPDGHKWVEQLKNINYAI